MQVDAAGSAAALVVGDEDGRGWCSPRSAAGEWVDLATDLGTTPGDVATAVPRQVFDLGDGATGRRVRILGVSWDGRPDVLGLPAHVFVVDRERRLWGSTRGAPRTPFRDDHGVPAPGVTVLPPAVDRDAARVTPQAIV